MGGDAHALTDHRYHVDAILAAHPSATVLPYARKLPLPALLQRSRGRIMLPRLWRRFVANAT